MLLVYGNSKIFDFFQCGDRLYTSDSDVIAVCEGSSGYDYQAALTQILL